MGSAASTAYQLGEATSGATGVAGIAAGLGGVARAGAGAVAQGARSMATRTASSLSQSARTGREAAWRATGGSPRSEEHTSELQSLMRISYAVFCLKNKHHNQ